jgi:serine/threonine-protein kinase
MATEESSSPTQASMDTELGRMVVEHKLATQQEVDRCLSLQAGAAKEVDARQQSLADLLVQQGAVTISQIRRLKARIEESRRGQQIPGYQIKKLLGSGAQATTFMARQLSLDRLVAIKVLPKRLSENPNYVERFYREGRAAARLNHPNIAQAFDVGEAGGYHYFVMEYVEGRDLAGILEEKKVFSEAEALRIIIQVARALEHAHSQGLIHRDVKPKNIMITKDGMPKLVDMGLARAVGDEEAAQAEAGKAFGTPYYISPEQIRGEVDIDFRADIYSLGATLYRMVTGRVPFDGPTPTAVMHKHLREPLTPPDHINTSLSSGLGEVVEVMMAKDRERRYASTSDLLMDLEAVAAGEPPLQARRAIDAGVLSGLAREQEEDEGAAPAPAADRNIVVFLVLLSGALAISIILNVFLLLSR